MTPPSSSLHNSGVLDGSSRASGTIASTSRRSVVSGLFRVDVWRRRTWASPCVICVVALQIGEEGPGLDMGICRNFCDSIWFVLRQAFGVSFTGGELGATPLEGVASATLFGFTVLLLAFLLKVVNLLYRRDYYVAAGLYAPLILLFTATGALSLGILRVPQILQTKPGIWLVSPLPNLAPTLTLLALVWLMVAIAYGRIRHVNRVDILLRELPLAFIEVLIASFANVFSFIRLEIIHIIHATFTHLSLKALQLPGGIAVVIFLQLLIIIGEGFFASVQSLRLLYYETLTKFYEGTGRVFKPHKISS